MSTSRILPFIAALALLSLPAAYAQVVLDAFDDGDFSNVFQFSEFGGAGVGIGATTGPSGSPALRVDINPAETGAFAGFGFSQPAGGTINASGQEYFAFFLRANVAGANTPVVLELNLQEDVGNDGYDPLIDDEYQAKYLVEVGDDCWQLVQIPLASFTDDNSVNPGADDGFDFSKVLSFVVAIGGPTGPAYSVDLDVVAFRPETPSVTREVVLNDFEGDVSASVFVFSATNAGIGVGPAAPAPGATGSDQALSVGVNPAETGPFAGFVITRPGGGVVSASPDDYIGFWLRPNVNATNTPLVLELNLHEDPNNNGVYDGATEDEFQANYLVEAGDAGSWRFVAIPLAAFTDDNAVFPGADDGFDYDKILEVVVAFGGLGGDEFTIEMDDVYFGELLTPVAVRLGPIGTTTFPASGGRLRYAAQLINTTGQAQTLRARIDATLPNGSFFGPIQGPQTVTLPAGATVTRTFAQQVPSSAPAGTYCLVVTLSSDGVDFAIDTFTFEKEAPAAAASVAAPTGAYPNPFTTTATIPYVVETATEVRLAVYDVMGREVAVLVDGPVEAGAHEARFDGRDLASGVYVWRLTAGAQTQTGRLTLAR